MVWRTDSQINAYRAAPTPRPPSPPAGEGEGKKRIDGGHPHSPGPAGGRGANAARFAVEPLLLHGCGGRRGSGTQSSTGEMGGVPPENQFFSPPLPQPGNRGPGGDGATSARPALRAAAVVGVQGQSLPQQIAGSSTDGGAGGVPPDLIDLFSPASPPTGKWGPGGDGARAMREWQILAYRRSCGPQ